MTALAADEVLPVVACQGLRADSLGSYLAALGLLRVAARGWPQVRGAWHGGHFCLVGGPPDFDRLAEQVIEVGRDKNWSRYERAWKDARDAEKQRKPGELSPLSAWRAQAAEDVAELSLAHSVASDRLQDNPLLGQGGAASRRDFARGWADAVERIAKQGAAKDHEALETDLHNFLTGDACTVLGSWNAASWFSQANKLYNFSSTRASVDGQVTPWAMALACEGLVFFAGAPSRRLGSRARGRSSFPFVTRAAAPESAGQLAKETGEVWCPLWSRPMTVAEVRLLFLRGRAELGGRGAVTPAAFAAAALRRGVDAGVDHFARFVLGQTTNPDMFESKRAQRVPVSTASDHDRNHAAKVVAERLVSFVESLPTDKSSKRNGRFVGLRGPVEAALVEFAARPDDPEAGCRLLDAVASAVERVDRNRVQREHGPRLELLPCEWVPTLFGNGRPPLEARLALGLASVGARDDAAGPILVYRFGVAVAGNHLELPSARPARVYWTGADLVADLGHVARRRLVEAEHNIGGHLFTHQLPFGAVVSTSEADIGAWLEDRADPRLLDAWLRRFVLFNWTGDSSGARALASGAGGEHSVGPVFLYGVFRSLVDRRPLRTRDGRMILAPETGARSSGAARRFTTSLAAGQIDQALAIAFSRYRVAGHPPARFDTTWCSADRRASQRLLASLLFQSQPTRLAALAEHWLRPQRTSQGA